MTRGVRRVRVIRRNFFSTPELSHRDIYNNAAFFVVCRLFLGSSGGR